VDNPRSAAGKPHSVEGGGATYRCVNLGSGAQPQCHRLSGRASSSHPTPISTYRAFVRWQHAAGPFWPYVSATPFLSGGTPPWSLDENPNRTFQDRLGSVSGTPGGDIPPCFVPTSDQALFIDLPLGATLPLAPALNHGGRLVVPVIQRWCPHPAVIPSTNLITLLSSCARLLHRPATPRGVIFLLDGERAGPKRIRRNVFDNRYRYNANSFPPAVVLRQHGIALAGFVCPGEPAQDLWAYLAALRKSGMDPAIRLKIPSPSGRGLG